VHEHLSPHVVALAHATDDTERLRLIETCRECRKAAECFTDWTLMAQHPDPRVAGEMDTAHRLLRRLRELPVERALQRISVDDEFHRWGLARRALLTAEFLLGELPQTTANARLAYEHAVIAVAVTYELDWDFYGADYWGVLLEDAVDTLNTAIKALGEPRKLDGLLDRLFDLLLEVALETE
jgi:hypothetical protein